MAVHINNKAKAKIPKLFIALICFASLANASFGINQGAYQQKEVILTSITGDKVNYRSRRQFSVIKV
jgi:hypothetical protein